MITVKCIEKFRNTSGQIIGYRLQDINGQTQESSADNLKKAIKNNQVHVVNLTLTSDNRLIDTNEKQLQSKALGKPMAQDDICVKCAKAMIYIDKELMDMGDNFSEIVENVSITAGINIDTFGMTENQLEKAFITAYIKIAREKPETIASFIKYRFEYGDDETLEENMKYEHVSDSRQSKIYKSMAIILTYLKAKKQSPDIISKIENFLNRIGGQNANTIEIAYKASHEYYKYLDNEQFGTVTNDFYTVGHKIKSSDIKEFKELKGYEYICHKDLNILNAPRFSIAMLFRSSGNEVKVDFKFARQGYIGEHSIGIVGYFMNITSVELLATESAEEMGKKIANVCNKIVPKMHKMVKEKPELGKYAPIK